MNNIVALHADSWDPCDSMFRMRRVARMSPTAQSYRDADRVCRYANRACLDWFRVDPDLLVGSRLQDFTDVLGMPLSAASVDDVYRGEPGAQA